MSERKNGCNRKNSENKPKGQIKNNGAKCVNVPLMESNRRALQDLIFNLQNLAQPSSSEKPQHKPQISGTQKLQTNNVQRTQKSCAQKPHCNFTQKTQATSSLNKNVSKPLLSTKTTSKVLSCANKGSLASSKQSSTNSTEAQVCNNKAVTNVKSTNTVPSTNSNKKTSSTNSNVRGTLLTASSKTAAPNQNSKNSTSKSNVKNFNTVSSISSGSSSKTTKPVKVPVKSATNEEISSNGTSSKSKASSKTEASTKVGGSVVKTVKIAPSSSSGSSLKVAEIHQNNGTSNSNTGGTLLTASSKTSAPNQNSKNCTSTSNGKSCNTVSLNLPSSSSKTIEPTKAAVKDISLNGTSTRSKANISESSLKTEASTKVGGSVVNVVNIVSSSSSEYSLKTEASTKVGGSVVNAVNIVSSSSSGSSLKIAAPAKKADIKDSKDVPTLNNNKIISNIENENVDCNIMAKQLSTTSKLGCFTKVVETQPNNGTFLNDNNTNKIVSLPTVPPKYFLSTTESAEAATSHNNVHVVNQVTLKDSEKTAISIIDNSSYSSNMSNMQVLDKSYFSLNGTTYSDLSPLNLTLKLQLNNELNETIYEGINDQHLVPILESTRRNELCNLSPNNNDLKVATNNNLFKSTDTSTLSPIFLNYGDEKSKISGPLNYIEKSFSFIMNSDIFLNDLQKHKILAKDEDPVFKTRKPITIYNDPKITSDRNEEYKKQKLFTLGKTDNMDRELKNIFEEYKEMLKVIMNIDSVIKRPAEKSKFIKKLQRRCTNDRFQTGEVKSCIKDIYTSEYLQDIINYEFMQETKYLLTKRTIEANKDGHVRIVVVDWLIKLLDQLDINQSVYLATIRIFDKVKLNFKRREYQMVIIVSLWIAFKYNSNDAIITVHKLFSICHGKFSSHQIKEMEIEVLELLNFDLNISDPLDFLYFYMKNENLENNKEIESASNFIIEYSTLFPQYSCILPSLVADAALILAKKLLKCDVKRDSHIQYNDPRCVAFYANLFLRQLKWLGQPDCPYIEVIERYKSNNYCNISHLLLVRCLQVDNID